MNKGVMFIPTGKAQGVSPQPMTDAQTAALHAKQAEGLEARGQFAAAVEHYAQSVSLQPGEARFHWLLAMSAWKIGQLDRAGAHLQKAVELDPNFPPAQSSLGAWYLNGGMIENALQATTKSFELAPHDNEIMHAHAWVLEAAGEMGEAAKLVAHLLSRGFTPPSLLSLNARLVRGREQEEAALSLITRSMQTVRVSPGEQFALHFAASGLLDSLGRYDEAFAHAARGNALLAPPYNADAHDRNIDRMIEYFTRERLRSLPRSAYLSDKPVFIVGMPRSGTSLVEQIIASHPDVHGGGELDFMFRTCIGTLNMLGATEEEWPAALDRLSLGQAEGMSQIYLEPLLALNPSAKRITDKMPLNFLHLGLISILIPQARIIHCKRGPLDTCLSCHMTAFSNGNDFKYNLTNLGRFYRLYERLMKHWQNVEIPMLEVSYEKLVSDHEFEARRMIAFLDLQWDERCVRFHETERPVATASNQQVRRPVYRSSIQRWRNYEKHLGPLLQALKLA